jgi:hypothetical protein
MSLRITKISCAGFVSAAILLLGVVSPARASVELYLTDGTHWVDIISDNVSSTNCTQDGAACSGLVGGPGLTGGMPGLLQYSGSLGNFNLNVQTATTLPAVMLPTVMDLASTLGSVSGGTLTILWAAQGFTNPPVGPAFIVNAQGSGAGINSLTYKYNLDNSNGLLGGSGASKTASGSTFATSTSLATSPFSLNNVGAPAITGTFSLTEDLTVDLGAGASLSSDDRLSTVPEPASIALLGAIVLVTVKGLRRKTSRSQA